MNEMQSETTEQFLDQIRNPSPESQKIRDTWESKSPAETVTAARKLLHGLVAPALTEGETLPPSAIEEIEAVFEATVSKLEQYGRTKAGARSPGYSQPT